jgi:hypothetical protein
LFTDGHGRIGPENKRKGKRKQVANGHWWYNVLTYVQGLDLVGEDDGDAAVDLGRDGRGDERVEVSGGAVDEDGGDVVGVKDGLLGCAAGPLRLFVSSG